MYGLIEDIQFAWRNMRRRRMATALIVITLALGIGANSAMFSMMYHVLLAPLPYDDGDRLVRLQQIEGAEGRQDFPFSVQSFFDYRDQNTAFSNVFEYHTMQFTLLGNGDPVRVQTGVVNWNFFDVLGIRPVLGRSFNAGEDEIGAEPLILLSHEFWQSRFAADPDVVGTTLEMNNAAHRVIGVLPPIPGYPDDNDIWITVASCPFRTSDMMIDNRNISMVSAFGRLSDGVTIEQAHADVNHVAQQLITAYPDSYSRARAYQAAVRPVREELVGDARGGLLLLMGIATLVVLIASANVANLNLARVTERSQELAVREAVGAHPRRIMRQLLTESTLLALLGGLLGLALAWPALDLLARFAATYTDLAREIRMSWEVLAFSALIMVLTGLLSGSAAAFTRRDINKALKEGGDRVTTSLSGQRRRQVLLVVQFALSFVILTSAVLITLSLYRLGQEDPGFDPNDVLVVSMDLNFTNYSNADQAREFGRRLLQEVESLPEVQVAALSGETPLESGLVGVRAFEIEGRALSDPDLRPNMSIRQTSADYHALLGIPLLAGRTLAAGDDELAERVVVINRAFERAHFPDGAAVGERISDDGGNSWWRIVGVTGDIRARSLEEVEGPTAYVDFRQLPITGIDLFVRSAADLERLGDEIVDRVHAMDSQQAVDRVRTMEEIRSQSLATPRLIATLVGLFGVLALLVTLSGVIGVVSWNVAQRIREVGVRIAVGANPDHVIRMFLVQGLRIHIFGLLLGLCLMVALASLLGNFLYGGEALDTAVYLSVVLVMTVTAVAAMYVPARRAGQLDPNAALASE